MAETTHKIKVVNFKGRRVPIMLQDVNGPCPLLAIANVMLLRNQLQLPADVGEITQARLVEMVAGQLLDANSQRGLSEEHAASLAQNLADAIALLPQLCTGIDVNLRFHDIRGFEYTREIAVFDLLDIQLVHGWLVDPQDAATAAAVGSKSYNELVVQLVTTLGSASTPKQLTPSTSLHRGRSGEALTPHGSGFAAAALSAPVVQQAQRQEDGQPMVPQGPQQGGTHLIDADMLSAALRDTLRVAAVPAPLAHHDGEPSSGSDPLSAKSVGIGGGGTGTWGPSRAGSAASSMQTSESMHSVVNRMLNDIVSDAFTPTPTASRSTGQVPPVGSSSRLGMTPGSGMGEGESEQEATSALRQPQLPSSKTQADAEGEAVQLVLMVLDDSAAAERPVQVHLTVRDHLQLPSPFESPLPSPIAIRKVQHSAIATPHTSAASIAQPEEAQLEQQQQVVVLGSQTSQALDGSGSAHEDVQAQQAAPMPMVSAAAGATTGAGQGTRAGHNSASPTGQNALVPAASSRDGSPGEAAVRDALLVQQFLEGSPSQLTYHGLMALHEGLHANQLAVFFRNNHFNTLFKGSDGQLFILVTDEGFQFESDVVWEALDSVDGDTQLVDASFRPFRPHASQQEAQQRQAAARDEDWGAVAAAAAATGGETHDADLALAMQLQAEEEERVRLEQQRRQQQLTRQQEQQRQAQQQQAQLLPSQQRPPSADSSSGKKKKVKKSSSDCCIQ